MFSRKGTIHNFYIKTSECIEWRKNIIHESGSVKTWRKTTIIMWLLCINVLLGLTLKPFNTLIIDEDVRNNPDPTYDIENVICGSYHQGDRRFGDTAGFPSVCNYPYAQCWSQISEIGFPG